MSESPQWRPLLWNPARINRTIKHTYKYAQSEAVLILGLHEGHLVMAQLRAELLAEKSRVNLAQAGVKTIGEVGE